MPTEEPQSIDVTEIEKELTALWKESGENEGAAPVVRACSLNLIVLGGDDPAATEILDLLSTEHPARTFLISTTGDQSAGSIESWVAAKCAIPLPGEKQVCSEQIHLRAAGDAVGRIASVVASLLVPDVPVVLWHRGTDAIAEDQFDVLYRLCDFAILDSTGEVDLDRSIRLAHAEDAATFGDLAWERGHSWRGLLAQVFDPPSERRLLEDLSQLRIVYADKSPSGHNGFPTALLFAGWLCHVLDLHGDRTHREGRKGFISADLIRNGSPVHVEVSDGQSGQADANPIRSLLLGFGKSSLFLSVNDSDNFFRTVLTHEDGVVQERSIPQRRMSDAEMLSRLLTLLGSEPAYRLSLTAVASRLHRPS